MDDRKIVDLYWARSETAIEETSKKYGGYCYSIAFGVLSDREDAEESVNDTYLSAWNSMPPHKPSILSTFLGKITRRISIDKWRRRSAEKRGGGEIVLALGELDECVVSADTTGSELDRQALADVMRAFVRSLSDYERQVFLCRYWYLDSIKTICERLGYSESRVKSMLARTRKKLRLTLEKEGLI